jgi:hypothetical protein
MKKITKRQGLTKEQLDEEKKRLLEAAEQRMGEIPFGRMLRCRVRYFTDGAVIGSREFVNEAFMSARELFRSLVDGKGFEERNGLNPCKRDRNYF